MRTSVRIERGTMCKKYIQAARERVSSRERRVVRYRVGECMVEDLEA